MSSTKPDSLNRAQRMMESKQAPFSVCVVGSGGRVRTALLPALTCLHDDVKITAVVGRSADKLSEIKNRWRLRTEIDLKQVDFSKIDLVLMAVTRSANPVVVEQLLDLGAGQCHVMVDTPVFDISHFKHLKQLRAFKSASVTEDTIALPPWRVASELIRNGRIGQLKKIWFLNGGYRHHALARSRRLVGGGAVRWSRVQKFAGQTAEYTYGLGDGVTVSLVEPRTRTAPRFLIAGSKGWIANYKLEPKPKVDAFVIENRFDQAGRLDGLTLNGEELPADRLDRLLYERFPYDRVDDHSPWNLHKVRGCMELISAVRNGDSSHMYPPLESGYDILAMKLMHRTAWIDPLAFFGGSMLKSWIRLNR